MSAPWSGPESFQLLRMRWTDVVILKMTTSRRPTAFASGSSEVWWESGGRGPRSGEYSKKQNSSSYTLPITNDDIRVSHAFPPLCPASKDCPMSSCSLPNRGDITASQRRAGEGVGAGISKESMEGEAGGQDAYQAAQALESVTDLVSKRREPVGGVGGPGPPWSFSRAKAAGASLHNGR